MAPPLLLIFTCVCLYVHLSLVQCRNTPCTATECRKTSCPLSCSCLGSLVDCSKKGLIQVPMDIPLWVEILDMKSNDITSLDDHTFDDLLNITELDLSNNQLKYLNSSTVQRIASLKKLVIQKNHLVELPRLTHQTLSVLSLKHNKIHSISARFLESLPNLQYLDLSFNNLLDLHADTFGCSSSLRHLLMNHNRIVSLEKGVFDNITGLESLKLNKNKLSSIPKEFFRQMGNLRHLEMNSNSLIQIEGLTFQGLTSLNGMKLRHGSIAHLLDGAFYGLTDIKNLQLDYNNISKVTRGWLYGLNSLQRIYLNNNNISEIDDGAWDSGKRLIEIDMTHNKLQFITVKTFAKLYSLKYLILSDNLITYIEEGAFRSLSALQYLELRNNELSWTIENAGRVFIGLDRLKFLGLANNNIKAVVKQAFRRLTRLETLNLTQNQITTIEENVFDKLLFLQNLLINTSSLLCDCNLQWMSQNNFHADYPITAICGYPETLAGLSVFQVPPEKFVSDSPKPIMIKQPAHMKITLKGENVTLECQARSTGLADVKFLWRKDGKLLQGMAGYRLWQKNENKKVGNHALHTSWLSIQNIQDKDEGRYQCAISNRFGSVYSNKAHIRVHVFPVFTKTPVDITVKTGSTARLECGAEGQPPPDITWRKDGGEDFPAARERRMHVMLPTDDVFFIVGVKASDTGVYSCTAQNVAGVIAANATLTVLETPSFAMKMEDKETRAGETAVLECMAVGSPKPKLTWFKDGAPLIPTERHYFTVENQLLIILLSKVSDSGTYTCEMSNTLGTERDTSHLNVLPAAQSRGSSIDDNNMTGIIVIAVVVCVVGTSIIWVIVIHHTRKTQNDFVGVSTSGPAQAAEISPFGPYENTCPKELKQPVPNIYLDSHSGHSKDSGTGDSAQPSSDNLMIEEDDQGLLLEMHSTAALSGAHRVSSLLGLHESMMHSQNIGEPYASSSSSVSKEQVPLLPPSRTSHSPWKSHRKSIAEFRQRPSGIDSYVLTCSEGKWPYVLVQRSLSADQVNFCDMVSYHRGCSEPPKYMLVSRVDSEGIERDSGFSTFPRSITQASVSNWSTESPRLHRLPKDIPNDSGSFSIDSEDVHLHSNPVKCVSSVASIISPTSQTSKYCVLERFEPKA